jgi:hypothetical protein
MNRLVGNVIIVDSAMGNSFILDSAGVASSYRNWQVNAIEFIANDTTGVCILTLVDTTNHIKRFTGVSPGIPQDTAFALPQYLEGLKVPTLTAGTAWIYLA